MRAIHAQCISCGTKYELTNLYTCKKCGGILDVIYDYSGLTKLSKIAFPGMWAYFDLLPVGNPESIVSLGEGWTPLLSTPRLGQHLNVNRLYVKNETVEPSGSFKDRPVSVAISKARELGARTVVTSSSGNAGASAAAYAARAGLECYVFVPAGVPQDKLTQIRMYGAHVILAKGHYSNAYHLAKEMCSRRGWFNLTSTYASPYPTEADKTVAYEIWEQLKGELPDWIVIPIASGPLLAGMYKGFRELKEIGLIANIPRFIGVQAEGCAPIVRAFDSGIKVIAWEKPETIASGISDSLFGYEQDGDYTLWAIHESNGYAVSVSDAEIIHAAQDLAGLEGIYAETTGAAAVAGVEKLLAKKVINPTELVVSVVTGSGFKDNVSYGKILPQLPAVSSFDETEKIIDSQAI
ncbi:MAG: threonine synthase [Bacteroidota bacterium]